MNAAIIVLIGLLAFVLAFKFYAKYIQQNIFLLDSYDKNQKKTPAVEFEDGIDYVPTTKDVLLGHHFSSIAGAAPIVGPAVASIWGWLPAVIWIIFGVIFMGAVHDFGALVVSMEYQGRSLSSLSSDLLGKRVKNLFMIVVFFLVWMVIAVFALVIANLFISFPSSVIPVNFEIFIALIIGSFISRGNKRLFVPSIIAQIALLFMMYVGGEYPVSLKGFFGEYELFAWIVFLMVYSFIASVLPVTVLLQPRDYINGHQLIFGLALIILGLFIGAPAVVAPALNLSPKGAPDIFPFLFITIACGAISGFHGLVSGGTSSKQIAKWKDAKGVGYGAMLGEGLLALIATVAVCAGFESSEHWHNHYSSWQAANGLSAKINAFVTGSSNFISHLGIPLDFAATIVAVLIISFAATSLDTATRIQRYLISEFSQSINLKITQNRYVASFIAIMSAFLLMIASDKAKGGLMIWPLFGATNQILALLTLVVICTFLYKKGRKIKLYLYPAIFLFFITCAGIMYNISNFLDNKNYFLMSLGFILLIIELWICIEAFLFKTKN
ncbi:MAG: carbon starvation protein A [Bacteriovoracaceae bacterium]|jgi:carbon starvation protein|nr:carbon starvation protein A [Bacteriovoracaceae bacterium]